jgi:hypothetical protein
MPALLASPYHATSQNPQDSRNRRFRFYYCSLSKVDRPPGEFCNRIGCIADMAGLGSGSTRSRLTQPGH